jgi:serine/threonine protein kinase
MAALNPETHFGQYCIIRLLGRGGMGEVYEAEHWVLERRYALKLLPQDFAARSEAVKRFEREAASARVVSLAVSPAGRAALINFAQRIDILRDIYPEYSR